MQGACTAVQGSAPSQRGTSLVKFAAAAPACVLQLLRLRPQARRAKHMGSIT